MKESWEPQQQENLENLLMQLKINLARNDLDKMCARAVNIVSGCMGMIKSRSIIPHSPTPDSRLPTPHHSGVTGIDIRRKAKDLSPPFFS